MDLNLPHIPVDADLKIKILQRILDTGPKGRAALLQSFVTPIATALASGVGAANGYFNTYSTVRICQQLCDGTEPGVDSLGVGFDRTRLAGLVADALSIMNTPKMVALRKRAVEQYPERALGDAKVYAYVLGLTPKTEAEQAEQAHVERVMNASLIDALYN